MIINHIAMKISSDLVAPLSEGVLNYFQPFNRGNLSISGRSNKAATLIEAEAAAAAGCHLELQKWGKSDLPSFELTSRPPVDVLRRN